MHVQFTEWAGSRIANAGGSLLAAFFILTIPSGCSSPKAANDLEARREDVAAKGEMVMPFDLDRSTHVFDKTADGGLQQVLSDDGDAAQIALIRAHLSEEAARFSRGDFHDPAMIHGDNMAGLHQLMMGHDKMTIEYTDIDSGGQVLYRSNDPAMVEAIHLWFDAQLSDHGNHARGH
jgi:hypothetical protein